MKNRILQLVVMMMVAAAAQAQSPRTEVATVASVDLNRYAGKWYEVARFPTWFQTKCAGEVSAEYNKRDDGTLEVINRCRKADNVFEQAAGQAVIVDAASNAKLKVRFVPAWLSWLPGVWGKYWIIALAPDYSYAVVGEPSREFLWVLSRTPTLPEAVYQQAVRQAAAQGFDVSRLVKTRQEWADKALKTPTKADKQ
ncbi:MAG: blc [Burkholderiaceae bacterium]|nr:blc [Burkholderiaceae bacterium]